MVHAYLAAISFVDALVGEVLDALDQSSYARDTIIVSGPTTAGTWARKSTFTNRPSGSGRPMSA